MQINKDVIIKAREERGWSQNKLAKLAGVDHKTVYRIESTGIGRSTTIWRLVFALDLKMGDIKGKADGNQAHKETTVQPGRNADSGKRQQG